MEKILAKYQGKEKAGDPKYRKDHIQQHYPEHFRFIVDITEQFAGARLTSFMSETLKWERAGIIRGAGVAPSLDHRKKK